MTPYTRDAGCGHCEGQTLTVDADEAAASLAAADGKSFATLPLVERDGYLDLAGAALEGIGFRRGYA